MKENSGTFQNLNAFLWICSNFLIYSKITFSECKICVKYLVFCRSCLTNFPLAKLVHLCQLSLNTIERVAISRVFENIWNCLKNRDFCEILLKNQKGDIYNKKNIKNIEILITACQPALDSFFLKELIVCFQIFPGKLFFLHFFIILFFTCTVWLNRFQDFAETLYNWRNYLGFPPSP